MLTLLVHFEAAGKNEDKIGESCYGMLVQHIWLFFLFCWLIFVVGIRGIIENSKEQGQIILYLIKMKIQLVKDFK